MSGKRTLAERFAEKYTVMPNGCWFWTAYHDPEGYGRIMGENNNPHSAYAHRVAYELFIGQIPDDVEIDHLCRNRMCVNPAHLEAVPHRINVLRGNAPTAISARKAHCKRGHPFTLENTGAAGSGGRRCKTCMRERDRERYRLDCERRNKPYRPYKTGAKTVMPPGW